MIHLFNKIYLKPDRLFKDTRKRIVVSPNWENTDTIPINFKKEMLGTEYVQPLYKASSFEELISKCFYGYEENFPRTLMADMSGERLTIYASTIDLVKIHCKFLKTLYPHWTSDDYCSVERLYLLNYRAVYQVGYLTFTKMPASMCEAFCKELDEVLDPFVLKKIWDETTPWNLQRYEINKLHQATSVELQIPTCISNPNWKYRKQVEDKFTRLSVKSLLSEFIHYISTLIRSSLVNFDLIEPDTQFDITKHTLDDLVTMHPEYRFIWDPEFVPDNVDYILNNYDLDILNQVVKKVLSTSKWNDTILVDLMKSNLTFQDILEFESNNTGWRFLFRYGEYAESVNPYFVEVMLNPTTVENSALIKRLELK